MAVIRRCFLVLVSLVTGGCAPKAVDVPPRAPNPNGCYVVIYDRPEFRGTGDVLNGPGRWPTLDGLRGTNIANWRDMIRSLRVGESATVLAYTEENLAGRSMRFEAGAAQRELETIMAGRVKSLELNCR